MINQTDISLLDRFRNGDVKVYELLFKEYYEPLCKYAVRYLGNMEAAEETVQDLFCTLWEKREELTISSNLKGYLFGAVRNNCLRQLKHLEVRNRHQQEVLKHADTLSDMDPMVELELSQKIEQCIESLPVQRQKIFRMSRQEGKKYKEIAEELGLSIKTVEVQMSKALKVLREELVEYLPIVLLGMEVLLELFWRR
ncbi:RNA polymerase sigma-70 factor [Limibacter armeniacum]|uniref:RNA polymerase sigma-70 factor n=1 Tax=Limibacter armeniacum TaxID=466084 RepID=UPI002FE6963B